MVSLHFDLHGLKPRFLSNRLRKENNRLCSSRKIKQMIWHWMRNWESNFSALKLNNCKTIYDVCNWSNNGTDTKRNKIWLSTCFVANLVVSKFQIGTAILSKAKSMGKKGSFASVGELLPMVKLINFCINKRDFLCFSPYIFLPVLKHKFIQFQMQFWPIVAISFVHFYVFKQFNYPRFPLMEIT